METENPAPDPQPEPSYHAAADSPEPRAVPPAEPVNSADPAQYGYRSITVLPVQARRNYAVFSLMASLYLYWVLYLVVFLEIVVGDVAASLLFLFNDYWLAVVNLAAVAAGWVTLVERQRMSRQGWLPCNRFGLPLGRATAWTGLIFGLAHLALIVTVLSQPDSFMDLNWQLTRL